MEYRMSFHLEPPDCSVRRVLLAAAAHLECQGHTVPLNLSRTYIIIDGPIYVFCLAMESKIKKKKKNYH